MSATLTRAWQQVSARVRAQRDYGQGFRWLDLELPASFQTPVAGQFVQLLLEPASPVLLPRPMSVASAVRRSGKLTVGFLYAPVGVGTQAIAALEPGSSVQVLGPLGVGYPLEQPGTPVLIAGGRGVAPLLMAADALARQRRKCEFLFGARSRALLVGLAEAKERLARMGSRLHLVTDDGSRGTQGNVVTLLDRLGAREEGPFVLYACGPHGMLRAVARWAMA